MRTCDWMLKLDFIVLCRSCVERPRAAESNLRGNGRPSIRMFTPNVGLVRGTENGVETPLPPLRRRLSEAVVRFSHAGQAAPDRSQTARRSNIGRFLNSTDYGDAAAEHTWWHSLCKPFAATIQFNSLPWSMWRGQCQRPPLTTTDSRDVISLGTDSGVSSGKSLEAKPVAVARLTADTNPCLSSA